MDNYQIIRRLGEGSQAVASLALDRRTNKHVVIKRLPANSRSKDEMNLRVKHPGVIESIESFVADDFAYFVTAYAEGGDLEAYLNHVKSKQQTIPTSQIFSWVGQLCRAVKACHDARVIHRDIKPSNIFLSKDTSKLYLGDFGTAKQFRGGIDVATTFVGSPVFLSPEVISGTPYSFMADVWSLGCVFYEMIALRKPFDTSNFAALVVRICAGKYDPLPQNTPQVLANAVHGMLTTDANERWMLTDVLSSSEFFCEAVGGGKKQTVTGGVSRSSAAQDYTSADFGDWVSAKLRDVASLEKYLEHHRPTDEIVLQRVAALVPAGRRASSQSPQDAPLNPERAKRMIPSPRKLKEEQEARGHRTPPQRHDEFLFERRPVSEEPKGAKARREAPPRELPIPPPLVVPSTAQPVSRVQPAPLAPRDASPPTPAVEAPAPKARQDIKAMIREQRLAKANAPNGNGDVAVEILLPSNLRNLPQNKV